VSGGIFVFLFATDRGRWWAAIPGFTLLGLVAVILLPEVGFASQEELVGALFLASVALGFWAVLLTNLSYWWAAIPAGVITSVAVMVAVEPLLREGAVAAVLFLSLSGSFALVAVLPTSQGRRAWAWIPTGILLAVGLIILSAVAEVLGYVWPALLIIAGAFVLVRAFTRSS
jgi:hypothetical protein